MIGKRLKEERERLKLTQAELAVIANAGKRTVCDWEANKTSPTALQLSALFHMDFDINYIITGHRLIAIKNIEEEILLKAYRELNQRSKKEVLLKVIDLSKV